MRRILLFFMPFLIFSCNSNDTSSLVNMESTKSFKSESFESLIEEKFQEFYNLNILLRDYPDFKEDIEKRISNFTTGTRKIFEINDSIKILNIRQKGSLLKLSDSMDMTQVLFDIITENEIKTDSVYAFITKKKIMIDGQEVTSKKVKFTRIVIQKFDRHNDSYKDTLPIN